MNKLKLIGIYNSIAKFFSAKDIYSGPYEGGMPSANIRLNRLSQKGRRKRNRWGYK